MPKDQDELEELIKKFNRNIMGDDNDLRKKEVYKKIQAKLGYTKSLIQKMEKKAMLNYTKTRKATHQF